MTCFCFTLSTGVCRLLQRAQYIVLANPVVYSTTVEPSSQHSHRALSWPPGCIDGDGSAGIPLPTVALDTGSTRTDRKRISLRRSLLTPPPRECGFLPHSPPWFQTKGRARPAIPSLALHLSHEKTSPQQHTSISTGTRKCVEWAC